MLFSKTKKKISEILASSEIEWEPFIYTKKPPVLSTIYDIFILKKKAKQLHKKNKFSIVHCRSYISAFAGLFMKKKYGIKFIFDMRGFYADERVDGKIWNLKNPVFYLVYHFFKRKEITFLKNADHIISLTNEGKKILEQWGVEKKFYVPISVIPCCADLNFFSKKNVSIVKQKEYQEQLKINDNNFILSYLGSVGTWYMPDEMLDFFLVLLKHKPNAKFLFITKDNPDTIKKLVKNKNIPSTAIIIQPAEREEIPSLLGLSNFSIFFIKPVFSKKASSPTKMGEILGLGIPIICNSRVGDIEEIIKESKSGILIDAFNENEYKKAISEIENTTFTSDKLIGSAEKYYSLKEGVSRYNSIYSMLVE